MEFEDFLELVRACERERVAYILVGGVAVNVHGIVRATEGVDLFVRPDAANVERLKAAFRSLWDDPEIDGISAEDLAGDYPTLRYGPPDSSMVIDVLTRIGTKLRYEDLEAETIEIEGVNVSVATPGTLVRMKRGTLRPIDQADALALAERFGIREEG